MRILHPCMLIRLLWANVNVMEKSYATLTASVTQDCWMMHATRIGRGESAHRDADSQTTPSSVRMERLPSSPTLYFAYMHVQADFWELCLEPAVRDG